MEHTAPAVAHSIEMEWTGTSYEYPLGRYFARCGCVWESARCWTKTRAGELGFAHQLEVGARR